MSEEKVLTLRGKKAVWAPGGGSGPIDPKRLPEGYPYKEQSETVIEWDGNTDGKVYIDNNGMTLCKVSDATPNATDMIGGLVTVSDASQFSIEESNVHSVGVALLIMGDLPSPYVVVAFEDGFSLAGTTFPEKGVYFSRFPDEPVIFASGLTVTTETIHPMAPEFLPAGVGGGAFFVHVTMDESDNYVADKTYAEISEALVNGQMPYCICGNAVFHLMFSSALQATYFMAPDFIFVNIDSDLIVTMIEIFNDGGVHVAERGTIQLATT